MYTILNAQAPQKTCNTLNIGYKGIEIAFILLGVENDDLEDKLEYTYDNYASANQYDMHEVSELARNIYIEWLCDIKNFFLTKKVA